MLTVVLNLGGMDVSTVVHEFFPEIYLEMSRLNSVRPELVRLVILLTVVLNLGGMKLAYCSP